MNSGRDTSEPRDQPRAPRISVIIPLYQGADTISQQLEALCSQNFPYEWELIIADNGSTDGGAEIAAEFRDRLPIRILDASMRSGGAAARNDGAASARAPRIAFLDQDDVAESGWLNSMVSALETDDLVVGVNLFMGEAVVEPPSFQGIYHFLPFGLSNNMAIWRETFFALGGFNESYQAAGDVEFCWRAQLSGLSLGATYEAQVHKRRKSGLLAAWRQHVIFGYEDVLLYQAFSVHGMPRNLKQSAFRWGWLATRLPLLVRPQVRETWVRVAARALGRLRAAVLRRALYL